MVFKSPNLVVLLVLFNVCPVRNQFLLHSSDSKKECNIQCSRANPVLVCATDGRTYRSLCEIERAKCEGHPIEVKHHGKCPASARCLAQRDMAEAQRRLDQADIFKPRCKEDGSFMEVQCHESSGYCWCVDEHGKPLPGSSVKYGQPKCNRYGNRVNRRHPFRRVKRRKACSNVDRTTFNNNLVNIFKSEFKRLPSPPNDVVQSDTEEKQAIYWKFGQLDNNRDGILRRKEVRDLQRMAKKIVEPRLCAKTFTRHCDFDHDKKISLSEWTSCLLMDINHEQVEAETEVKDPSAQESSHEIKPLRDPHYPASQPETKTSYPSPKEEELQDCRSARKRAQENLDNTFYIPRCKKRNGLYKDIQCFKPKDKPEICWCVSPKNGKPVPRTTTHGGRPPCKKIKKMAKKFKGCQIKKKQKFLAQFMEFITEEMLDSTKNVSISMTGKPTRLQVARWKFNQLDLSNNQMIDRKGREEKEFKRQWKLFRKSRTARKGLTKCWGNFLRFCDKFGNNDSKISISEWLDCTETKKANISTWMKPNRHRPHPFIDLLKD
ncbi:SPARC-related modular calcium-binding protein 1-like isoform X2 [Tachypleus tridentatus]|uniref:SPARC-related modular calcium-binding protein 1-like isoform X2 n=1 Tax=Tachypleus tridentatus TaxID=6853 RepID=UPI003FD32A56